MMKNQLAGLMKQAQAMQENMKQAQDAIAAMEVEGEAGGGMVKVVMTGRHDVKRVTITRTDGTEVVAPLNEWRGFAYAASSPDALPNAIRAYDASGRLVDEKAVDTSPSP